MVDTFSFDKEHLQNLKAKVTALSGDLMADPAVIGLQEWGTNTLWDPSSWNAKGGGTSPGGSGTAMLMLLPGNPDVFPAAKLLSQRGSVYASGVIEAVNWLHDVLTNLATNIDFTVTKVEAAEHDNKLTVDQAIADFNQTIGDLGGAPAPSTPAPPGTTPNPKTK